MEKQLDEMNDEFEDIEHEQFGKDGFEDSEGIQKFLFAADLGAGRFAKIGIPSPEFFGPFVGSLEITCGLLLLLGLFTRLAAIPLLAVITTAIITTKLASLPEKGLWSTAHEGRTDYAMLLSIIFLVIVGGGRWSLDARLFSRATNRNG
jgi:uncharacterized membrane protein YphA (DoxX/SURF4 family)